MSRVQSDDSLALMHSAVALVLLVPLLVLMNSDGRRRVERERRIETVHAESRRRSDNSTDQPPIITISEAHVYAFPSGSAAVAPEFARLLEETIVPKLHAIARRYRCDVIEVIGHTDGQAVKSESNLDSVALPEPTAGSREATAGSNADLGLMRAWAVIRILRADGRLAGKTFHGYSAGQAILPDGRLAEAETQADATRRRIEIRLRRFQ